jgi:hypothetical protein
MAQADPQASEGDPPMDTAQTSQATQTDAMQMREGDDFVCPNCSCEIRLRHHGDPAKMTKMDNFTCCCGTQMEKEQRSA